MKSARYWRTGETHALAIPRHKHALSSVPSAPLREIETDNDSERSPSDLANRKHSAPRSEHRGYAYSHRRMPRDDTAWHDAAERGRLQVSRITVRGLIAQAKKEKRRRWQVPALPEAQAEYKRSRPDRTRYAACATSDFIRKGRDMYMSAYTYVPCVRQQ